MLGSIGSTNGHLFIEKFPTEDVPSIGATTGTDGDDASSGYVLDTDALLPRYRRNQVLAVGDVGNAVGGDDVMIYCASGGERTGVLVCQFLFRTGDVLTVADFTQQARQSTIKESQIDSMRPIVGATRAMPGLIPAPAKIDTLRV